MPYAGVPKIRISEPEVEKIRIAEPLVLQNEKLCNAIQIFSTSGSLIQIFGNSKSSLIRIWGPVPSDFSEPRLYAQFSKKAESRNQIFEKCDAAR